MAGVDSRTDTRPSRRSRASPATSGGEAASTLVHCPEATSVFSTNAPMPKRWREFGAVLESHLLLGVVGAEAVPRASALTGTTLTADRAPVQDDVVAGSDVGDVRADRLDHTGSLVAEQEREVVVDATLAVVQIGMADPARLNLDDDLARPRIRDDDGFDR